MRPRLVLIGNPENRRLRLYRQALQAQGFPEPGVLPWVELLDGAPLPDGDLLRIDSPGEDEAVRRRLVRLGGGPDAPVEHGEIRWGAAWYAGLRRALLRLPEMPGVSDPGEILCMFDKAATSARLEERGVAVPRRLGLARSWQEVQAVLHQHPRIFAKRLHGSSASGVLALQARGEQVLAWTSVEEGRGGRLYNNLRVHRIRDATTIGRIIDRLGEDEGLHLEAWVPKASTGGRSFDLRVLCIAGQTRQVVVRTAMGPLTNLHLGNARGDTEALKEQLGAERWDAAMRMAEAAARAFPRSLMCGVDLLLTAHRYRPLVIEVNAFGDLLPGVLDRGEDSYAAQVSALLRLGSGSGPAQ